MNRIQDTLNRLFKGVKPLPAGMYHYQAPLSDPRNYRLHLRLEPDGQGILIINAATILHLNQTAAEFAFYLVQNQPEDQIIDHITNRYRIGRQQAREDFRRFKEKIDTFINTPDLDPVTYLDVDRQEPFSGEISAPYRLDCALTYQLPETDRSSHAPNDRVSKELSTAEWKEILDKAWSAGIPHIVFTGGEPTLRPDLAELIAYAESNSQVTGLLSDGIKLADQGYLDALLQTGLDHLMVILQTGNEAVWEALRNALAADLFVAVHLTLTQETADGIFQTIDRLAELGVLAVSLSASHPDLSDRLQEAYEHAAAQNLELVWNLPVPYSRFNPVAMEVAYQEEIPGHGKAWLYVEPDGDVLPAQGINHVLGNLLADSWDQIWEQ